MSTYGEKHGVSEGYSGAYAATAEGYLFGHSTTINTRLRACSLTEARRMFDIMLEDAKLVNVSSYEIEEV